MGNQKSEGPEPMDPNLLACRPPTQRLKPHLDELLMNRFVLLKPGIAYLREHASLLPEEELSVGPHGSVKEIIEAIQCTTTFIFETRPWMWI